MDQAEHIRLYTLMARSRAFEELAKAQVLAGKIPGSWMSGTGQEGVIGALSQLRKDDHLTYTHRGAYAFIARGSDPGRLLAELFGRVDGYCRGKGGRHIADLEHGIYGKSGTIGAHATLAVGMGIAVQIRGGDEVVMSLFGDGTSNRGTTHSSLVSSAVKDLPIVWLCENNGSAGGMRGADYNPHLSIADLARAYDFPGITVDGNDVLAVHEAAGEALARARGGSGPTLIELNTYRLEPFAIGAPETRDEAELAHWRARDPIDRYRAHLLETEALSNEAVEQIQLAIQTEMQAALIFAEASDFPDADEAFEDLYA